MCIKFVYLHLNPLLKDIFFSDRSRQVSISLFCGDMFSKMILFYIQTKWPFRKQWHPSLPISRVATWRCVLFWDFCSELNDDLWYTSQATKYLLSSGKCTSVIDVRKHKRPLLLNPVCELEIKILTSFAK